MSETKIGGLRELERELAYTAACSLVESSCAAYDGDELCGWFDTSNVDPHAGDAVSSALLYLELRGLLERDPSNLNIVSLRDECNED